MGNEQIKQDYIRLNSQLLTLRTQIESLNKDYATITNYLNKGLKINDNILNSEDWNTIGNNQKYIINDLNQVVLPVINRNINS